MLHVEQRLICKNMTKTPKQIIGNLGEGVACIYLQKHGFKVIQKNYWKKWGEIDIIAKNKDILHFIEVKTVSRENLDILYPNVNRETSKSDKQRNDYFRAEDNLHPWKLKRLSRAIQSYLLEKNIDEDQDWQLDAVIVYLDTKNRLTKVKYLEDITL